jgi:hypothetical protein
MHVPRMSIEIRRGILAASLGALLLAPPLAAAEDPSALLAFEEVADGRCQILSEGGKLVLMRNLHPTRAIRYRLVRMFMEVPQGRVDGEIAAGEAPQKLGCSRVNRRVQSWRVERATLLEASK